MPFASVCVLGTWALLCAVLRPDDVTSIPIVVYKRDNKLSRRNIAVLVLSVCTLTAFASFEHIKHIFGDIGLVALLFVSLMFGSGMLSEVCSSCCSVLTIRHAIVTNLPHLLVFGTAGLQLAVLAHSFSARRRQCAGQSHRVLRPAPEHI